MNPLCALGRHRPAPLARWNHGYYFSRCQRCGQDLVRTAFETWHVPHGYRVVWSATPPANLRTAKLAPQQTETSAAGYSADQRVSTVKPSASTAEATAGAPTSGPAGNLPISEVLTLLRRDEAKSETALKSRAVDEIPSLIDDFMASDEADRAGFWPEEGASGDNQPRPAMENPADVEPSDEAAKSAEAAPAVGHDEIATAPVRIEPDIIWPSANKTVGTKSQDEAVAETREVPEAVRSGSNAAAEPPTLLDEPGPPTDDAASPSNSETESSVVDEEGAGGLSIDEHYSPAVRMDAGVETDTRSPSSSVEASEATPPLAESDVRAPQPKDNAVWPSAAPTQAQASLVGMDEPRQRFGMVLGLGVVAAVLIAAAWFLVFRGNPFSRGQIGAVSAPEAETASGEKIVVPTGSTPAYVTARLLNCRASSELRSHSVTILPRGQLVRVIAREPGWISVAYEGRQCWVAERYLSAERPL